MIAYIITSEGNISLVLKGEQFFVTKGADNYDATIKAIKDGLSSEDDLFNIVHVEKKVATFLNDTDLVVKDGTITYQGVEIHNTLTERIFAFMRDGLPTLPLVNFLKKLMSNPSYRAQNELFDFLNHKSLPITNDGDFLAYKAVTSEFKDKRTQKLDNSIGKVVTLLRAMVDDNREIGCSQGLHAGTLEYVNNYGDFNNSEQSDKCIIVKINPADVVSVPSDCSCQKLRTCKYKVLKMYEGEMTKALYGNAGDEYQNDEYDDEYDDDPCEDCTSSSCKGCEFEL